ncbi:MAG TPA: hypothetical protein VD794_05850 [Flavisolibacter sp.]|nr:hypothetical protein [Flavisolibacter sp.]
MQDFHIVHGLAAIDTFIQVESFKQSVKDKILDGKINPLEFYRQAKLMSECIDELKSDAEIKECAFLEREKWGKEKAKINGSIIDRGSKTTYDYKYCNDSVWNSLKEQLAKREQYLKSLPAQGAVDPESGELVYPPKANVSEYITVKI